MARNKTLFGSVLFISLFLSLGGIIAQTSSLYFPLNIQKAYKNETRSITGQPGEKYWQNRSDYKISVEVFPETKELKGIESIVYTNNSPDPIGRIVLRLYQDYYKKGNVRDYSIDPEAITDGVKIESLKINGEEYVGTPKETGILRRGTNAFVRLDNPIVTGGEINVDIKWNLTIPEKTTIRMGAYDSTSFMIGYWFPQISVYDDIDGWDMTNYGGTVEFYNDFGKFDVEITVPDEFIVWGTGVLQNPEELLESEILEKYNSAYKSDDVVRIVTKEDREDGNVTLGDGKNIWKFKADYVPDFAFGMSDHYLWDGVSLVVDKQTGRRTFIAAAYNEKSKDFYDVADIAKTSIDFLSNEMPAVPFPYPEMTVFNGEGGMEFPMIVNDGSYETKGGTVGVTSHEITHTYFPFYMGTNERKYAWMDEGWAQMLPFDIQERLAPESDPRSRNATQYSSFAGMEMEQPMMIPSNLLTGPSYRVASYMRAGAAYEFLKDYLGIDKFKTALHDYIKNWNGKHPIPYDFFFTFNNSTKENLDWYWKPWFFENGYPELAITDVKTSDEGTNVTIEKIGNVPVPVFLKFVYTDGTEDIIVNTVGVWKNGETKVVLNSPKKTPAKKVELGNSKIPDAASENNYRILIADESNNILKKYEGKYQIAPQVAAVIILEGDKLFAQIAGQPKVELFLVEGDEYELKVVEAKIKFIRNEENKINKFILYQGGREVSADKIE